MSNWNKSYNTYSKCNFIENVSSFLPNLYSESISSGVLQGALNAVSEYAKQYPVDATQMGIKIAQATGITPEHGLAFASGFLGAAHFEKSERKT